METFADFMKRSLGQGGWTLVPLAERAGVSTKSISDAASGKMERSLASLNVSAKKRKGVAESTQRILRALNTSEAEIDKWLTQLGLTEFKGLPVTARNKKVEFNLLLFQPVTEEDIQKISEARIVLGDVLTVEVALRIIGQLHFGTLTKKG